MVKHSMSLFTKKESHHYERDSQGRVTKVIVEKNKPLFASKTPVSKALTKKYYEDHPEETKTAKAKKALTGFGKRIDTWAMNWNKAQAKSTKKKSGSKKSGGRQQYHIKGGIAYPIAGSRRTSSKKQSDPFDDMFNFDMFNTSSNSKKKRKNIEFDPFDNHGLW